MITSTHTAASCPTAFLPCVPESASAGRNLAAWALHWWGLPALQDDVELVVSELVANAARYARCAHVVISLTRLPGGRIRVDVRDGCTEPPVMRAPDDEEETGRGLVMVDALADKWGSDPAPGGKTVWAEFTVSAPFTQ